MQINEIEEVELKPCPFCGGDASIDFDYDENVVSTGFAYIECKNCSCRTRSVYVRNSKIDDVIAFNVITLEKCEPIKKITGCDELIDLWNNRVGGV